MTNRTYTLDEIRPHVFKFEGGGGEITLEQLRTLQKLQPDSMWVLFTLPETEKEFIEERRLNNYNHEI